MLTMQRSLMLLTFAALALLAGSCTVATEAVPCLLVGGVSFAPVELLPSAVQMKITGQLTTFNVEGMQFVPFRCLVEATGGKLTARGANSEIFAEWAGGPTVTLHCFPNTTFWRQATVADITDFAPEFSDAVCQRVVDGDTILLTGGERVRYIGIDTPETKHPTKPVEAFGREASAYNDRLVSGNRVRLEYDVERRDRYGRLLAYVYVGDTMVNAALAGEGFAQTATYPPNVRYVHLFAAVQSVARAEHKGLWGETSGGTEKAQSNAEKYVGSKRGHAYHYPNSKCARSISVKNLVRFRSVAEARSAGYHPCPNCKPPGA